MSLVRYFVVQSDDAWMIRFANEEFGPYRSKSEAVLFAVDGAKKLVERGGAAEVGLLGPEGGFIPEWTSYRPAVLA